MSLEIAEEVRAALADGRPVVALESTIIAHGFPEPDNLEVGREIEAAVRAEGAVPATIAIVAGRVRIGLDGNDMERLAAGPFEKCSVRDLAAIVARGGDGATTVSATAHLARRAGIDVFATGGIGGVHPPIAGTPLDVSADLPALARTPILVVSAGAKSILDLAATLETLETLGVVVAGYGTDEFPGFHTAESGLELRHRVDSAAAAAELLRRQRELGLEAAVLLANPPPAEAALALTDLKGWIAVGEADAAREGISGPALTPYLLGRLDRLSGGATTRVNRALATANAALGARVARHFVAPA